MNKKVFLITIYYILGTIGGLYFNNIILFLILLLLINRCIFKKDKRKFILLTIIIAIVNIFSNNDKVVNPSGRQEMLEAILNQYIFNC